MTRHFHLSMILTLILSITSPFLSAEKAKGSFELESGISPFFCELGSGIYGLGTDHRINGGVLFQSHFLGLELRELFFNTSHLSDPFTNQGYWNHLQLFFKWTVTPVSWFRISLGAGGVWNYSNYQDTGVPVYTGHAGGPSVLLDFDFLFPWRYIELKNSNTFDWILFENLLQPYYTGKMRLSFLPGIRWLNLFVEAGFHYRFIQNDILNLHIAALIWSTGITFKLNSSDLKKESDGIRHNKTLSNNEKMAQVEPEEKLSEDKKEPEIKINTETEINFKSYQRLIQSQMNDRIDFEGILVSDEEPEFNALSIQILMQIADILKKKDTFIIGISAYSESLNDPIKEIEKAVWRARKIRSQLILSGVDANQLKILTTQNIYDAEGKNDSLQNIPLVTFQILGRLKKY